MSRHRSERRAERKARGRTEAWSAAGLVEYFPARTYETLLAELGHPITWGTHHGVRVPMVADWAAIVIGWVGLHDETGERVAVLRRVAADSALRAIVRGLRQSLVVGGIEVSLGRVPSYDGEWGGPGGPGKVFVRDTGSHQRVEWRVQYDHSGAMIDVSRADAEPMPLHVAIAVQAAIDEFVRGDAVMHGLGAATP